MESAIGSKPQDATSTRGKPSVERQCEEIRVGLSGLLGGVSQLIANFDQFDAMAIQMNTPGLVDACVRASKTDGRFRGYLLSIVHVSAYSDIALYASMMLVPIFLHHFPGLFSSLPFGVPPNDHSTNGLE